jgi:hypothetical protein
MILLWVMSLLLYLAWAVTQLESVLALEIQSQASQIQYQSEFERAEALLAACEDRLKTLLIHDPDATEEHLEALILMGCQARFMSNPGTVDFNNRYMKNMCFIEMELGQGIRLRSVLRYEIPSQRIIRINWQLIHE